MSKVKACWISCHWFLKGYFSISGRLYESTIHSVRKEGTQANSSTAASTTTTTDSERPLLRPRRPPLLVLGRRRRRRRATVAAPPPPLKKEKARLFASIPSRSGLVHIARGMAVYVVAPKRRLFLVVIQWWVGQAYNPNLKFTYLRTYIQNLGFTNMIISLI